MDNILINSIIAGFGISIIAAILGCFVIWRKMAYFGDSLAHSTLLGIAFGILIGISSNITIIGVAIAFQFCLPIYKIKISYQLTLITYPDQPRAVLPQVRRIPY